MFLAKTMETNPKLIEVAVDFHQKGYLYPDTYVIDYDQTLENARLILEEAKKKGIELYFMTKQLGRNPLLAQGFMALGYKGAVVVDYREAEAMMDAHIPLGNVGHLVQTPYFMLEKIMKYGTEVMTVFTFEKLKEINEVAKKLNIIQDVILKVYSEKDLQYPAQEGGIHLDTLKQFIEDAKTLEHVAIVGATAFPAFLYDLEKKDIEKTHNYQSIMRAISLMKQMGCTIKQVNAPSTTSVRTLQLMENTPVTHGEPGHGLTGSTPAHALEDMPEKPSVVYLSEVSHNFGKDSYAYGGGHYRRSHVKEALNVYKDQKSVVPVEAIAPDNIDYYFKLKQNLPVSSPIIMAFRFQIFVTRSRVAIIKGVQSNNPEILGIYDSLGKKELI